MDPGSRHGRRGCGAEARGGRANGPHPGGRHERIAARGPRGLAGGSRLRRLAREADPGSTFPEQVRRYCAGRSRDEHRPRTRASTLTGQRPGGPRRPATSLALDGSASACEHRPSPSAGGPEPKGARAMRTLLIGGAIGNLVISLAGCSGSSKNSACQRGSATTGGSNGRSTRSRRTSTRRRRGRTSS